MSEQTKAPCDECKHGDIIKGCQSEIQREPPDPSGNDDLIIGLDGLFKRVAGLEKKVATLVELPLHERALDSAHMKLLKDNGDLVDKYEALRETFYSLVNNVTQIHRTAENSVGYLQTIIEKDQK